MTRIEAWARSIVRGLWLLLYGLRSVSNRIRLFLLALKESTADWGSEWHNRIYERLGKPVPRSLEDQRELLIEFYEQFEEICDLLCNAAHHGQGTPWQAQYARLRVAMAQIYPRLRPRLIAHLTWDSSDTRFGLRCVGRPTDAFEALFVAPTLDEVLQADQGDLMDRLDRTRSALYRYADYLRNQMAN